MKVDLNLTSWQRVQVFFGRPLHILLRVPDSVVVVAWGNNMPYPSVPLAVIRAPFTWKKISPLQIAPGRAAWGTGQVTVWNEL